MWADRLKGQIVFYGLLQVNESHLGVQKAMATIECINCQEYHYFIMNSTTTAGVACYLLKWIYMQLTDLSTVYKHFSRKMNSEKLVDFYHVMTISNYKIKV